MSSFFITCRNCGRRSSNEFSFGGEVIPFPLGVRETADESYARIWLRKNVRGIQAERWFHSAGCRRWTTVGRDTLTNEVTDQSELLSLSP